MSHKTAAAVAHTIGIDTGKNTLHLIGLDNRGAIVLREKIARGRIPARLANVPAQASKLGKAQFWPMANGCRKPPASQRVGYCPC
jgi:hypothetical protein